MPSTFDIRRRAYDAVRREIPYRMVDSGLNQYSHLKRKFDTYFVEALQEVLDKLLLSVSDPKREAVRMICKAVKLQPTQLEALIEKVKEEVSCV